MPDGDSRSLPRSELRRLATVKPGDAADRLIALQAERDRLREALDLIVAVPPDRVSPRHRQAQRIAQEALDA